MVIKALLISIFCWLGGTENPQPLGAKFSTTLAKPLVGGAIVGLILGDLKQGIIIGVAVQTMYIANVMVGGAASADMSFVSYPCIAIAMLAGADAEVTVTLAATIGVLGAAIFTAYETVCSVFFAAGDKAIEKGDMKALNRAYKVYPVLLSFAIRFGLSFIFVMLGSQYASDILNAIPDTVLRIASVTGGILPAVGMSILLAYTLKDLKMIAFFMIGVISITQLGLNLTTIAILAFSLAVIYYMFMEKSFLDAETNTDEEDDL